MEGLLILGLLIAGIASGGPKPTPEDLGPPAKVTVELVSLRLTPSGAVPAEVYGYLSLSADVQDSPALPVEKLELQGGRAFLPGTGLIPYPFRLEADGRWHVPKLKDRWREWDIAGRGAPEYNRTVLTVYPLVRDVGPYRRGWAGLTVWLYLEGKGWYAPAERIQQVPVEGDGPGARQVFFETPYGRLGAYLVVRPVGTDF